MIENKTSKMEVKIDEKLIEFHFRDLKTFQSVISKFDLHNKNLTLLNIYYFSFDFEHFKILLSIRDSRKFSYESYEEIFYYLFSKLKFFSKEEFDELLTRGLNALDSKRFIFMVPSQRTFLLEINGSELILNPISQNLLESDLNLKEFYTEFFSISLEALPSFTRTRIRIDNKKIIIDYYDMIDQFLYILQKILASKKLFTQNFSIKDFILEFIKFLVRNTALAQMSKLNVECDENHPLYHYKYLTLITYRVFAKLAQSGSIENLTQSDITQLANGMTYEENCETMPTLISDCYVTLKKVMPIKTLEKILKKQKVQQYCF
jgi:hypothetical protein